MVYRWPTNEYATEMGTSSSFFKPKIDPSKGYILLRVVVDKMENKDS